MIRFNAGAREHPGVASVSGKIYAIGGNDGSSYFATNEV